MTLGTGIFLSSIIISLVILFGITKERWNWKKIVIGLILASVGLCIVLFGAIWSYEQYHNRVTPQTEFRSLKLTNTKADVKFIKGAPDVIKDDVWFYNYSNNDGFNLIVWFEGEHIWIIQSRGSAKYSSEICGISIGSGYSEVLNKFGSPSNISYSNDNLERILSYEKYNVFFQFKENEVVAIGIFDPAIGTFKFKDEIDRSKLTLDE
jgi:hypothetical protein